MRRLRVLVLMDEAFIPPPSLDGVSEEEMMEWKPEYDVLTGLQDLGHQAQPLGVSDDLGKIRDALLDWKPHITFNLLEEFHGQAVFDAHVVSYLELMRQPYTGCNPRGLMLAHDKPLSKKILAFHRIPTPRFVVYPRGRKVHAPAKLHFPLLVKSAIEDASLGISSKSVVHDEKALIDRVQYVHETIETPAIAEEFIEGREFYVGVIGNQRLQTFPVWEMLFKNLPDDMPNIATDAVKWDLKTQKELGIKTCRAKNLSAAQEEHISKLCKRVYRALSLSGYARMDLRMNPEGQVYVLEANPNPNLAYGEDFAESAESVGVSYESLLQRILNLGLRYRPALLV